MHTGGRLSVLCTEQGPADSNMEPTIEFSTESGTLYEICKR